MSKERVIVLACCTNLQPNQLGCAASSQLVEHGVPSRAVDVCAGISTAPKQLLSNFPRKLCSATSAAGGILLTARALELGSQVKGIRHRTSCAWDAQLAQQQPCQERADFADFPRRRQKPSFKQVYWPLSSLAMTCKRLKSTLTLQHPHTLCKFNFDIAIAAVAMVTTIHCSCQLACCACKPSWSTVVQLNVSPPISR